MTKLKPCPFCGGKAEFKKLGTPRRSTIVSCTECHCSLESADTFNHSASWNTRPSPWIEIKREDDLPEFDTRCWVILKHSNQVVDAILTEDKDEESGEWEKVWEAEGYMDYSITETSCYHPVPDLPERGEFS